MPKYRFVTTNGGAHRVDLEFPDDIAARNEAKTAFAEAAHDALIECDKLEMTMDVETNGRTIYHAHIAFEFGNPDSK
jgi:hypothetical protein